MKSIFECSEHTIAGSHIRQYPRSTSEDQHDVLYLAVKQYRPTEYIAQDGDVTIIACASSGAAKELYEPIWEELFKRVRGKVPGNRIRAVFIADVVNQGQSGILNKQKIGCEVSYFDYARDLLSVVNHLRDEMIQPIMGFGHSLGGNVIINVALLHPRLFASLVVVEAVVNENATEMESGFRLGLAALIKKRDEWPSRDAAMDSLIKGPFHASWDQRVRDLFRIHGLRQVDESLEPTHAPVTLTTTKHQEVFSYARPKYRDSEESPASELEPDLLADVDEVCEDQANSFPVHRPEATWTYQQLPYLQPSCLYMYGAKSHMAASKPRARTEKLRKTGSAPGASGGARQGRVQEKIVPGSHWAPFEFPEAIAATTASWYEQEALNWTNRHAMDLASWRAVPFEDRSRIDSRLLSEAKKLQSRQLPTVKSKL